VLGGQRLPLPFEALAGRPTDVVVGIRPEAVSLGGDLELEVVLVEALGSDLLVHFKTDAPRVTISEAFDGEDDVGMEARFTARLSPDLRVEVGDRLRLGVDPARMHVFDPSTGEALR
jgi:multiple sugar transport system ATP-binding protein